MFPRISSTIPPRMAMDTRDDGTSLKEGGSFDYRHWGTALWVSEDLEPAGKPLVETFRARAIHAEARQFTRGSHVNLPFLPGLGQ